mgnify:CR=1 FL=1
MSRSKTSWIAAAVLALAVVPVVLPGYLTSLATLMLIYALLAMSVDILAGYAGRTPLCHGAIFGTTPSTGPSPHPRSARCLPFGRASAPPGNLPRRNHTGRPGVDSGSRWRRFVDGGALLMAAPCRCPDHVTGGACAAPGRRES